MFRLQQYYQTPTQPPSPQPPHIVPYVEPQRASSSFWNNWDAVAGGIPQHVPGFQRTSNHQDFGVTSRWSQDGGWGLQSLLNGSQGEAGGGINTDPNQSRNSDRSRSPRRRENHHVQAVQQFLFCLNLFRPELVLPFLNNFNSLVSNFDSICGDSDEEEDQ